jgi:hypothetical protein
MNNVSNGQLININYNLIRKAIPNGEKCVRSDGYRCRYLITRSENSVCGLSYEDGSCKEVIDLYKICEENNSPIKKYEPETFERQP